MSDFPPGLWPVDPKVYRVMTEAERIVRTAPKLLAACRAFMARTDLLTRWPCPDCGRRGPDEPKRIVESRIDDREVLHGCWLCNTDDIREMVRSAIAEATGEPPK